MSSVKLSALTEKVAEYPYFPTRHQLFIFRNWESVTTEKMAQVLKTDVKTVESAAKEMGLPVPAVYNPQYAKRGFITIIRNNWNILPYSQLIELLSFTKEQLAFTLKEDDFLYYKLGDKPDVSPVFFEPLNDEQKARTAQIKEQIEKHFGDFKSRCNVSDFDFIEKYSSNKTIVTDNKDKKEVEINNLWGIKDLTNGKYTKLFVEDFKKDLAAVWGINLKGEEKFISLYIDNTADSVAESHIVDITKNGIEVHACDEFGILRGLEYIKAEMVANGNATLDEKKVKRDTRFDIRFLYSFHALYGDTLLDGAESSYSDDLLKAYAAIGVNGVWLQGLLYKLVKFPWDPSVSVNCEKRIEGLNKFIERAARYGIKVYMYLNEPRSMPLSFFEKYPQLLGTVEGDYGALCMSLPEVQDYLYNSVKEVCEKAPNIGGFFTITASENLTNCYSREGKMCERCKSMENYEAFSQVNNIIAKAAHSVSDKIEVLAHTWGWEVLGCDVEKMTDALKDSGVRIMSVSEEAVSANIGGVETKVIDYSISLVGPGKVAKSYWNSAKRKGIKTLAKVQFNNTWECSTVPYFPVFDTVLEHIEGLVKEGVNGLMLGWTLGGYPSAMLEVASNYYFKETYLNGTAKEFQVYKNMFGNNANIVKEATVELCKAFKNYPFALWSVYNGPHQMGPANPMYEKPTGKDATMTGIPYDDLKGWSTVFPPEVYTNQYKLLSEGFKKGLDILKNAKPDTNDALYNRYVDFANITTAITCIYESSYNQCDFVLSRDEYLTTENAQRKQELSAKIHNLLNAELNAAKEIFEVMLNNSAIGYEASNHYFFNKYSVLEKVICCEYLKEKF